MHLHNHFPRDPSGKDISQSASLQLANILKLWDTYKRRNVNQLKATCLEIIMHQDKHHPFFFFALILFHGADMLYKDFS